MQHSKQVVVKCKYFFDNIVNDFCYSSCTDRYIDRQHAQTTSEKPQHTWGDSIMYLMAMIHRIEMALIFTYLLPTPL